MATLKPRKGGKFRVTWTDSTGVQHRTTLPKMEAQELYNQLCAQRLFEKSGIAPALGARAKNLKSMTFEELSRPYREYLLKTRAKANISYVNRIVEKWGAWRLNQITIGQVRPWLFGLLQQPEESREAVSTIKKLVAYFKRVFNYGVEMEIIPNNPILRLENDYIRREFRRVNKRTSVLSAEQFKDMVKDFPAWIKRPCVAAWCTGMRQGEVISLKWNVVDLVERLFRIQANKTKEGDNKTVGIEPELYDVLLSMQLEHPCMADDYVFLSPGGVMIGRNYFGRQFRKYADMAGYAGVNFHDFRHSYVVRKRREGFDRSVIKAQTGHHTDHMFHWYDKVDTVEIQRMAGFETGKKS